jgi:hypothetical protein
MKFLTYFNVQFTNHLTDFWDTQYVLHLMAFYSNNLYIILQWKPVGKRPLGGPRRRWGDKQ